MATKKSQDLRAKNLANKELSSSDKLQLKKLEAETAKKNADKAEAEARIAEAKATEAKEKAKLAEFEALKEGSNNSKTNLKKVIIETSDNAYISEYDPSPHKTHSVKKLLPMAGMQNAKVFTIDEAQKFISENKIVIYKFLKAM